MRNNFVDVLTEENQVLRKRVSLLNVEIDEKDKKLKALEEEKEFMQAKINELNNMLMNAQGPIDPQALQAIIQNAISQMSMSAQMSTTNNLLDMFDHPEKYDIPWAKEVEKSPFL